MVLLGSIITSRNSGVEESWESCPYERRGEGTEWHSSSRIDLSLSLSGGNGDCARVDRYSKKDQDIVISSDGIRYIT